MNQQEQKRIGTRELFSIIVLTVGLKLSDMTPSLFVQNGQNASWLVVVISAVVILIPLWIQIHLMVQNPNKNLVEVFTSILGRPIGYFVGTAMLLRAKFRRNRIIWFK